MRRPEPRGSSPKVVGGLASEWHLGFRVGGCHGSLFGSLNMKKRTRTHITSETRERLNCGERFTCSSEQFELRELTYGCRWCSKWITLEGRLVVCYGSFWHLNMCEYAHIHIQRPKHTDGSIVANSSVQNCSSLQAHCSQAITASYHHHNQSD